MPVSVLAAIQWLRRGGLFWAWALALATAVQLLAGHFQLAFITVLAVLLIDLTWPRKSGEESVSLPRRVGVPLLVLVGFLLAAVQLAPTWELKQRSQRGEEGFSKEVDFGNVPPAYFAQLVAPYWVYPASEGLIRQLGDGTNKIEAHLYFGLLPLLLALGLVLTGRIRRESVPWLALTLVGVVLAEGSIFRLLQHVPGFNFFRYPGRYGLLAQLGVAMLAAEALDLPRRPWVRAAFAGVVLTASTLDFYWVSRQIQYVAMVSPPMISRIGQSEVFRRLKPTDRVLAIDGNTLALSGAACVPPYLGMGPAEYYAVWRQMPDVFHGKTGPEKHALSIMTDMGVTHLLTEEPLPAGWPATLVWSGYDPFLHPRWGRDPRRPLYLYRFDPSPGRAYLQDDAGKPVAGANVHILDLAPHQVTIECQSKTGGDLVLTDIQYPGWSVRVDDKPAPAVAGRFFRVVRVPAGEHIVEWTYRSPSFGLGLVLTAATLACLISATLAQRISGRYLMRWG
jgi:hypothetical protein